MSFACTHAKEMGRGGVALQRLGGTDGKGRPCVLK